MNMHEGKQENSADFNRQFLPGLAIDTVIFGFHEKQLKVLLLQYANTRLLALPGGFIKKKENLHDAAKRILRQRTGLANIYLEQFYAFGDLARHHKSSMRKIMKGQGLDGAADHWLLQRFVSISYYALVDYTKVSPIADPLSERCGWHDLKDLPPLMQDHSEIVQKALQTLRENLDRKLIGFNLLPPTFTMGELQLVYETVLGHPIRRTSFQRKILALGILERVAKQWSGGAHKAPYLYRFALERIRS